MSVTFLKIESILQQNLNHNMLEILFSYERFASETVASGTRICAHHDAGDGRQLSVNNLDIADAS